jgi:SCY1-like protein 1
MVLLAPKLNYNNLNVELMKHFARLQAQDDQGMIRTNTTVCIGKIAPYINPQLRQRILLSAFPKAMRDPFPLARLSGLIAMANTDRFYTLKDIATRVLPCLCALTVDPEKDVRDEAFRTIKTFMLKLEKVSETPEMALELEKDVQACNLDVKNETSWTSWAVTSLSAKMSAYKGKNVQPSIALNTQPLNNPAGSLAATGSAASGATDKKPDGDYILYVFNYCD